jgi:hypothetical protein
VVAVLAVLAALVAGCGKLASKGLVGEWQAEQALAQNLEFTDNDRLQFSSFIGPSSTWYQVEGDQLTTGRLIGPTDDVGTWRIEGDKLIIRQHPLLTGTYKRAD